jgi:hypothetical protein
VGLLVLEDLAGPYAEHAPISAPVYASERASIRADESRGSGARIAAVQRPVVNAGFFVLGLQDLTAATAPFSTSNPYLLESGHDFDADVEHAGWFVPGSP